MSVQEMLSKMTPEDLKELKQIFDGSPQVSESVQPTKPKRKRRSKKAQASNEDRVPSGDVPVKPQRKRRRQQKGVRKIKGTLAARQNINTDTPRENLFLKMAEMNAHKSDTKIDRKLATDRTPTPRVRPSGIVEIECSECGYLYDINPCMALRDQQTRELTFVCNDCQVNKKGG